MKRRRNYDGSVEIPILVSLMIVM